MIVAMLLHSYAKAHQTMIRVAVSCVKYKEGGQKVGLLIGHDGFLIILNFTCPSLFYSQSQSLKEELVC